MKIKTERLILRRFTPADTAAMIAINADPRVMEWFPATMTSDQTEAMLSNANAHWETHGFGRFALETRDTNQFIGFTGLTVPPYDTPANPCVEVGWRLSPAAWGKGYASEAARACLQWGFTDLGLDEIVSFTAIQNTRSTAVMERLNMTRSDTDNFDHPMLPTSSPLLRHVLYRLSHKRWLDLGASAPR